MITYRDMTFCPFYADCASASTCPRPLTDEVLEQARLWWGKEGAPISQYMNKPDCHSDFENERGEFENNA